MVADAPSAPRQDPESGRGITHSIKTQLWHRFWCLRGATGKSWLDDLDVAGG